MDLLRPLWTWYLGVQLVVVLAYVASTRSADPSTSSMATVELMTEIIAESSPLTSTPSMSPTSPVADLTTSPTALLTSSSLQPSSTLQSSTDLPTSSDLTSSSTSTSIPSFSTSSSIPTSSPPPMSISTEISSITTTQLTTASTITVLETEMINETLGYETTSMSETTATSQGASSAAATSPSGTFQTGSPTSLSFTSTFSGSTEGLNATTSLPPAKTPLGVIVGSAVGGAIFLIVIVVLAYIGWRFCVRYRSSPPHVMNMTTLNSYVTYGGSEKDDDTGDHDGEIQLVGVHDADHADKGLELRTETGLVNEHYVESEEGTAAKDLDTVPTLTVGGSTDNDVLI